MNKVGHAGVGWGRSCRGGMGYVGWDGVVWVMLGWVMLGWGESRHATGYQI